jgi:hypothetical protein
VILPTFLLRIKQLLILGWVISAIVGVPAIVGVFTNNKRAGSTLSDLQLRFAMVVLVKTRNNGVPGTHYTSANL